MIKKIILIITLTGLALATEAPLYIKTITGKPNMIYFNKEIEVAKKLGINMRHNFGGCMVREGIGNGEAQKNKEADEYYALKLGKNWKEKLREETMKELGK